MDVITFPVNHKTTTGLLILMHGVIHFVSLSDATSCDKLSLSSTHYYDKTWTDKIWRLRLACIV